MEIPTLFKEYIWLTETINQAGRITFAEINEKWRKREEEVVTLRKGIEDINGRA
ncbi:MAG: hypothetical protein IJJ68_08110 [Prevotella sp.]|nr:hypothetical protein [Prevotella sp.]